MSLRIGVLGATGAVGRELLRVLETRDWGSGHVTPIASSRSAGVRLPYCGSELVCRSLEEAMAESFDLVLSSAGAALSREVSPVLAARGTVVIDNSSAFRMDPDVPLVVPELNGSSLSPESRLIANPNCSTIQLVLSLQPLHLKWDLQSIRVATYQAVSGAGALALAEMEEGLRALLSESEEPSPQVFPHPIALEALPHVGTFAGDETTEEIKVREESRRLLGLPDLRVSAHCVRVPVRRGHSEAVWASFRRTPDPAEARDLLRRSGVIVRDNPERAEYPLARQAAGDGGVFVGRIRRDAADPEGLCLWVVSDNLLKGAALNAVQIADYMIEQGWLK